MLFKMWKLCKWVKCGCCPCWGVSWSCVTASGITLWLHAVFLFIERSFLAMVTIPCCLPNIYSAADDKEWKLSCRCMLERYHNNLLLSFNSWISLHVFKIVFCFSAMVIPYYLMYRNITTEPSLLPCCGKVSNTELYT